MSSSAFVMGSDSPLTVIVVEAALFDVPFEHD
jgi:hypothetical protein